MIEESKNISKLENYILSETHCNEEELMRVYQIFGKSKDILEDIITYHHQHIANSKSIPEEISKLLSK